MNVKVRIGESRSRSRAAWKRRKCLPSWQSLGNRSAGVSPASFELDYARPRRACAGAYELAGETPALFALLLSPPKASSRCARAGGYVMIESLIYIVVWMVIVGLAFSAFFRCLSSSRDLSRNADDIARVLKAGERWRQDIREAQDVPRIVVENDITALEIPKQSGLTVYVFEQNAIWRRSGLEAPWQTVLAGVKSSRVLRQPRRNVVAWIWEVELQTKKKVVRVPPLFNFLAVAPNDQKL
jgi:hypothetical protein